MKSNCAGDEIPGWKFWKRRRYVVAIMGFLGFFNVYALRTNLSIAIVAMTENRSVVIDNTTVYIREFDWDSKVQGYVLSSFYYGYITTQLLGGWLAMRIGGKRLFGLGIGATALLTLITPLVANINVYLLIGLRTLEGILEGVTYPCMHAIWSQWAPPLERSRLSSFVFTGSYVGTVVSMPACALLAEWLGWPSIFYVFGTLGIIWVAMWLLLVPENPSKDRRISQAELRYINDSLEPPDNKKIKHPWGRILTSVPVWTTFAVHFSETWGFATFLMQLPKYMSDVLNFDLAQTGFMAACPYLAMSITLPICGFLADWLAVKKMWTISQIRKSFICGALLLEAIFLIGAMFANSQPIVMTFLILAVGFDAVNFGAYSVNYLDLAPQHASVMMGIGNTIGTVPGILTPILSGYIVTTPTRGEWQLVFFISAGICISGCIIFGCFGTSELQDWANNTDTLKQKPNNISEGEPNAIENKTFQHDCD